MKWLITGGCGFIGSSLIRKLQLQGGHSIRVVDNLSVGSKVDLGLVCEFTEYLPHQAADIGLTVDNVQLIVGDILNYDLAKEACKGVDIIVHLAANTGVGTSVENPRSDCMANVLGTFNYLEAARECEVKRFIFASSGAPAGEVEPPIHEELPPHPVSPYGASKLAGEGYCSAYKRTFGVDTVALRFGNVYGPGSVHKSSVVAKFIRQALIGEALEVYGDGAQTRDFIYIDDLLESVLLAATKNDIGGEVFQIATNKETTVEEMVQQLSLVLAEADVSNVEVVYSGARRGDVLRNFSDTSKAKNYLGWSTKVTLNEGLRKTVDYFINQRDVRD